MSASFKFSEMPTKMRISLLLVILLMFDFGNSFPQNDDYSNPDVEDAGYDEDVSYEEHDPCDNHYESDDAGECHHKNFPKELLTQSLGPKVKECCAKQNYRFHDNCEKRNTTHKHHVCRSISGDDPTFITTNYTCPAERGCFTANIGNETFNIGSNGQLKLQKYQEDFDVHDYCSYIECDDSWVIKAEVCLCPKAELLQRKNSEVDASLTRCCKNKFFSYINDGLECVEEASPLYCSKEHLEIRDLDHYKPKLFENNTLLLESKYKGLDNIYANNYCVAAGTVGEPSLNSFPLETQVFWCHDPCNGKHPCIRTCCKPTEIFTSDGTCVKMDSATKDSFFNNSLISNVGIEETNLDRAHSSERSCKSENFERKPYLDPSVRCRDEFDFIRTNDSIELNIIYKKQPLKENEFCVIINELQEIQVEICREKPTNQKFKFYPYVLIASCICLLLTLIVYTAFPKLLNYYTRVMRHFTISMMLAFIILSINQLVSVGTYSTVLCKMCGFAEQYFFLVTFTLMTAMSTEIRMQMSGKPCTSSRYLIEVSCGYLIPLFVTLMTIIVEFSAPRCATYRPRFAEEHCFFLDKVAKGIWFFLPIGIMLAINAIMFFSSIITLCKLDREKRRLNIRAPQNRNERMEQFLIFLKLFLGMGFIWTFEIIAGLSSDDIHESTWYVTDFVNMMQGFYIFLIFVCKRNVIAIIKGKSTRGYTISSKPDSRATRSMRLKSLSSMNHSTATHVTES